MTDRIQILIQGLDTNSVASVTRTLDQVKNLEDLTVDEKICLTEAFFEIFAHAHHTNSTSMPKLAVRAGKRIAKFGPEMMPVLFNRLVEADSETANYYGKALARNGVAGLNYLFPKLSEHRSRDHDLINLIQALAYFKIPDAASTVPFVLSVAQHVNHQVTSMALYTIGRLVQQLPPSAFSDELRQFIFSSCFRFLSHAQGLVRKNAARTLGKMLRKGLLSAENEKKLYKAFLSICGRDEQHNWDRAFIVRREAEDFLPFFHHQSVPVRRYTQSYKIKSRQLLCANTYHLTIEAPLIARKIEAGQFVIVRPHIFSERIPLSICNWDRTKGTIDIIVSAVGKTTTEINAMNIGDAFEDVVGPLGERSALPTSPGTSVLIGGGYGTGAIIPTARDIKATGNKVIGIVGARNKENLIMVSELQAVCDEVILTTNDGSAGMGGLVTDALREVLLREKVVYVLAIGPVPMMKAVSEMTRPQAIPTFVSLNAIMVDGTGMCGACRVTVGGETKFACFHGPDFDGHKVDFENLMKRQKMFVKEERLAFEHLKV
ncbi:MAG: sulfide/dihydroorotate dehydrogenase-like FAD/NAD-binding protein [Cyclobacteriaceae bacterium]|nr:sulfide/dihydroorotate dehydrogenase-like FAD/NAD-binding protein [Cyclobacteriaceae bacterium]